MPAPTVSYTGQKAGMYVYVFPPVRYADGHYYLKIGHSPYDPIIASLGTSLTFGGGSGSVGGGSVGGGSVGGGSVVGGSVGGGSVGGGSVGGGSVGGGSEISPDGRDDHAPVVQPTPEQIGAWYAGAAADVTTPLGREVIECVKASEAFFGAVLRLLYPTAEWEAQGSFMTTCVTSKSPTGARLLEEIAPGVVQQTGCNGAGAAASLAWGEEVAEMVRSVLERRRGCD